MAHLLDSQTIKRAGNFASRKLDDEMLSAIFSEALPPLDRGVLTDVADSFRSLEADREHLERLRSAAGGVETFLKGYRRYARIAWD